MIHYYLALNHIDMKGTHGKEFKKMARKLNKQHKLHIKEIVPNKLRRNKNAPILSYWWYRLFNWSQFVPDNNSKLGKNFHYCPQ